ncbi:UNVERIFIED_CONTAM: hypothetical protein K2H54_024092 [Gekko kuhli]
MIVAVGKLPSLNWPSLFKVFGKILKLGSKGEQSKYIKCNYLIKSNALLCTETETKRNAANTFSFYNFFPLNRMRKIIRNIQRDLTKECTKPKDSYVLGNNFRVIPYLMYCINSGFSFMPNCIKALSPL